MPGKTGSRRSRKPKPPVLSMHKEAMSLRVAHRLRLLGKKRMSEAERSWLNGGGQLSMDRQTVNRTREDD